MSMTIATCNTGALPPDALIPFPFGLEKNAARRLIASGELRARKLGRRWFARRSDVLALVDAAPAAPAATGGGDVQADLAAIACRVRAK
jgi:Helix-turn-helix domain